MEIVCPQCRNKADLPTGAVNRARKQGVPIYCGRICAGLARRKPPKADGVRKAEKAKYDRARRNGPLREAILAEKRQYHQQTYDPVAAAAYRHQRMPLHVEYCRQPAYKKKKRAYDRKYRAAEYGEFAEAYLLAVDINKEVRERISRYEIYKERGTAAKTTRRKRAARAGSVALG